MPCAISCEQISKKHDYDFVLCDRPRYEKELKVIIFAQRVLIVEVCFHPRPTKAYSRLFHSIDQVTPRPNWLLHLQKRVDDVEN